MQYDDLKTCLVACRVDGLPAPLPTRVSVLGDGRVVSWSGYVRPHGFIQ